MVIFDLILVELVVRPWSVVQRTIYEIGSGD